MKLPDFPECHHPLIKSLAECSDQELLYQFQQHRDQGKYFTAIFCRYGYVVYSLIKNFARSPVQADYLFAKTWRQIYQELLNLSLVETEALAGVGNLPLQSWIVNRTAVAINQADLPPVEAIHYSLKAASPPLWCYLEEALERLPATSRLIIVMAQTFHWSETRIAAYLQAEGEDIPPAEVQRRLQAGYQLLEAALPQDIQDIYLRHSA